MFLQFAFEVLSTTRDTKLARVYLKNASREAFSNRERMMILKALKWVGEMEQGR